MSQEVLSASNPPKRVAGEPVVRPRDASSLIVTRRERQKIFVLMGRRSPTARFMPAFLFFLAGQFRPVTVACCLLPNLIPPMAR
ncbi:MAG: hypothetical protein CM1200mP18_14970 [Gammaproteobacteria bacterium]|nr:MAG: hypothetical protein CM1200mP18_14970 [Gammaproteobacteria bacterium]